MAIEMPNILGQFLQGQQAGQDQRRKRTLAEFVQPALGGDKNALSQVYGVDPDAGMQLQGMQQKQATADKATMVADLQQSARLYSSAPPEIKAHLYGKIVDLTEKVGIAPAGSLPRQHDPALDEGFNKFLSGIAGAEDGYTLSAGGKRFDSQNRLVAEAPFAPERPDFVLSPDGTQWLPKPTGMPQGGGSLGPATQIVPGLQQLASLPGVKMTSGVRTSERNAAVGGVPNSQHLRGTAGDYVVPQAQEAQFIAQARQAGFEAIDEGDHIHVEQPPQRGAGPSAIPIQGARPKQDKPSDFERKLEMAKAMGATPDQLKQMVIGEGGGGKPSATQIKLANTAKAKLIDLKAMEDQLGKVETAFKPLKDSFSAGPLGGHLPTVSGKQFDAAVSLLKGMARKLTRTPGEGAMSDYESKLAELANPSRSEYEDVTADQIQQLRALVKTTREGYEALLQDAGGNTDNLPGNKPAAADDDDALIGKYL